MISVIAFSVIAFFFVLVVRKSSFTVYIFDVFDC